MITATITNIILEWDRFRVFFSLSNGIEENNLFQPMTTADDIKQYITERIGYYNELKEKELELQDSLIGLEL